jgi:hypothetical protein
MASVDRRAWSEAAGQLRYLSIRMQGYVAELPNQSLPPRGRVQWSAGEVGELSALTRVLARGEDDADRAAASLEAIDTLFRRGRVDAAAAAGAVGSGESVATQRDAEAALLAHYVAQRAIALDSLQRLQSFGGSPREAMIDVRPSPHPSQWHRLWSWLVAQLRVRRR